MHLLLLPKHPPDFLDLCPSDVIRNIAMCGRQFSYISARSKLLGQAGSVLTEISNRMRPRALVQNQHTRELISARNT